ncbi:MAG TPA: OsmC family protein [Vicinamibacterales bacterium]
MPVRSATAEWNGTLLEGTGRLRSQTGTIDAAYDWRSRSAEGTTTSPEELIAAAHAGCFSMALAHGLAQAGSPPSNIRTTAKVHFEKGDSGFSITRIDLETRATVPGLDAAAFKQQAENAKKNCPVSRALTGVEITLDAALA